MAREEEKLVPGKGAAFMKGSFRRLRQDNATWEVDFLPLPKPITQSETHYLGMLVAPDGSFLAVYHVEGMPHGVAARRHRQRRRHGAHGQLVTAGNRVSEAGGDSQQISWIQAQFARRLR
jgi:hypothetical protein